MNKILITGTNGMLGKDIYSVLSKNKENIIYAINRKKDNRISNSYAVDIRDFKSISQIINNINPDIVIHTAALVDLNYCEKNKEIAYDVNVSASENLAKLSKRLIYISTDSVYKGGEGNFIENESKQPINYYAKTKSIAEDKILRANSNSIIVRTNIYGFHNPIGNSLFEWVYKSLKNGNEINGFEDVFFNPLYTKQLANAIKSLLDKDFDGVINIGCEETLSKLKFLLKIANKFNFNPQLITPVSIDSKLQKAKRPKNTTLNLRKMKDVLGFSFLIDSGIENLYNDFLSN